MRIGELVEKTNVSKQAIHHYINEGFIPKPVRKGKISAEYSEDHVSKLRMIKELRDNYFLPLSVIKDVIKKHEEQPIPDQSLFNFKAKHFRPLEWLFEESVVGKDAYVEATGIDPDLFDHLENRGVIAPEVQGTEPVYAQDDVFMGRLIAEMDTGGIGPEDGFDPEALIGLTRFFRETIEKTQAEFVKPITEKMPVEERNGKSRTIADLMGLFFYYLNRKISC